jgi:hypothetical protein
MEVMVALILVGGLGVAYIAWHQKSAREEAIATVTGRLVHLRSAVYPATCSWCKNTSLAHKLIVFEHTDERWRPFDVRDGLAATPDHAVEQTVATIFEQPNPRWRRFCTEKCTRDFFATKQLDAMTAFGPCSYCDTRFPTTLVHCPQCGAARKSS